MLVSRRCLVCDAEFQTHPCTIKVGKGKYCSRQCSTRRKPPCTHGESRTRLYKLWLNMKSRCKASSPSSAYYFDRGISVCDEWRGSYEAFRDWAAGSGYADGLELDRVDNDRGYSPDNCRWATRSDQMRNTRKSRIRGRTSRFKGVSWCENVSKWRVQINRGGRTTHVGVFTDERAAAEAYDRVAKETFGKFAWLNFKEEVTC